MTASFEAPTERRRVGLMWVGGIAALELGAVLADVGPPIQPLLAIVFVMTCPGFILLDVKRLGDLSSRLVVAVGASVSFNVVLATVRLLGVFDWVASVAALAVAVAAASWLVSKRRARNAVELEAVTPDLEEALEFEIRVEPPDQVAHEPTRVTWKRRRGAANTSLPSTLLTDPSHDPMEPTTEAPSNDGPVEGPIWLRPETTPLPVGHVTADVELDQEEAAAAAEQDAAADVPVDVEDGRMGPLDAAKARRLEGFSPVNEAEASPGDRTSRTVEPVPGGMDDADAVDPGSVEDNSSPSPPSLPISTLDTSKGEAQLPVEAPEWLPVVASSPPRIDLNSATVETLITLPGVGSLLARRLVSYRTAYGPFVMLADLLIVPGLGPAKLAAIEGLVYFDQGSEGHGGARTVEGES